MFMLLLYITMQNNPAVIMQSTHAPFATEQACQDFAALIELDTNERLAKMIDEGAPVTGHKMLCQKLVDERPA